MNIRSLFRSKSTEDPSKGVATFVVHVNNEGFRYAAMLPNKDDGAPFILSESGFVACEDYLDTQSWLAESKKQAKKYCRPEMRIVCLLDTHDYSIYQTTDIEADNYEDKVAAMKWKLKELSGEEPEGFTIDLVQMNDGGGKLANQVLVVAIRNEKLAMLMSTYKKIGLRIDAFQIQEVALSILSHKPLTEMASVATLYIDNDDFLISIAKQGNLLMYRRIARDVLDDEHDKRVVPMRLVGEVVRSLDRAVRQFPDVGMEALLIDAGKDTQAFLDAFSMELEIQCDALVPYGVLNEEVAPLFFEQRIQLLVGAGSAVVGGYRELRFILPVAPTSDKLNATQSGAILVSFAVLAFLYGAYALWDNATAQQRHEEARRLHLSNIVPAQQLPKQAPENEEDAAQAAALLLALEQLKSSVLLQNQDVLMSAWMETIAATIPEGMWLTSIESAQGPAVTMKGVATRNAAIADWVDALNGSPFLAGKSRFEALNVRQTDQMGNNTYWEFEIKTRGVQQ